MTPDTSVLLLGSGGREHAIAWALAKSPRLKNLYALPGSDAMAVWAQTMAGDPRDPKAVVAAAREAHARLVVVGPEAPLAAGVADALRKAGLLVFGPGKAGARLEASKTAAKDFMTRHGIPTADYESFVDPRKARAAVERASPPFVLKADGLAAGKGVRIVERRAEAEATISDWMEKGELGEAGRTMLVERCLQGPEASILALLDGRDYKLLPPAQDHKRLLDGDRGPNTGGMGAYAPAPIEAGTLDAIRSQVLDRVMEGLAAEKIDYRGVLFAGLMLTAEGPKVLEFNCRLGDPETQAVLPLLESDFLELALACAEGRLASTPLRVSTGSCVCVTLASEGYPERPLAGRELRGLHEAARQPGALLFHAGTRLDGGRWRSSGGRVLSACALGADLAQARERAYAAAAKVSFDGMQYRRDIAAKATALTAR